MAFGEKYRIQHKEVTNGNATSFELELLKDGYAGDITDLKGGGNFGELTYEDIDIESPYSSPAVKGRFDIFPVITNPTQKAILDEIFQADEKEFKARLKVDGSTVWTGWVLSDMLSYSEGPYPFTAKITAKDLTVLDGQDFALEDNRKTIIEAIADMMANTGLSLDIYTYTSWTETNSNNANDFLRQIYIDTKAIRKYASSAEASDEAIPLKDALNKTLKNFGLILRQSGNAWRIFQITAIGSGSVRESHYDSSGTFVSKTTKDISIDVDRNNRFVLPSSMNEYRAGIKWGQAVFLHRSKAVEDINFGDFEIITGAGSKTFNRNFVSSGDQSIHFSARVTAHDTTQYPSGTAQVQIKAGQYWWDGDSWSLSSHVLTKNLIASGLQDGDGFVYPGMISIDTTEIPLDANSPISIVLQNAVLEDSGGVDFVADETQFTQIDFDFNSPTASDEDKSDSIQSRLTQSDDYSKTYEHGDLFYGDYPNRFSPAALRFDTQDPDLTSNSWGRSGESLPFFQVLLEEILDTQRVSSHVLEAELWGKYSAENTLFYRNDYYFLLGGSLIIKGNRFNGRFFEVAINTAGDDVYELIYNFDTGTGGVGGSSGGSGGTVNPELIDHGELAGLGDAGDHPWALQTDFSNFDTDHAGDARDTLGLGSNDNVDFGNITGDAGTFTGALTAPTLNTGQGDNELYPMNQGVQTTDTPTFAQTILSNQADATNEAVRADRKLRIQPATGSPITSSQSVFKDLTANRSWSLGLDFNDPLRVISDKLDIHEASTTQEGTVTTADQSFAGDKSFINKLSVSGTNFQGKDFSVNGTSFFTGEVDVGNDIIFHGGTNVISTPDYIPQRQSWRVDYGGNADFRTIYADEMVVEVFTANITQALAGSDILTKSVATLDQSFTIPNESQTVSITVRDLQGLDGFRVFESGDWVFFQVVQLNSTPAVILNIWGTVSSYSDNADGTQSWDFLVDYAGLGGNGVGRQVNEGTIGLDYGVSGDAYIERTVLDRASGSDFSKVPYDRIVRWTGSDPRTGTRTVVNQRGNVNGLADYTTETYGWYSEGKNGDKLTIDPDNGIRFLDNANNVGSFFENGTFFLGAGDPAASQGYADSKVFRYGESAFDGTDDADQYSPKPDVAIMMVDSSATGWPDTFGTVVTYWINDTTGRQVFRSMTSDELYDREVHAATYPVWSDWKEVEDITGAQAKADKKVFTYDEDEYIESDDASQYSHPHGVNLMITSQGNGWPEDFGRVRIEWLDTTTAVMVFTDATVNNLVYVRTVNTSTYPVWGQWNQQENVQGAQAKADAARDNLAFELGYSDYQALVSDARANGTLFAQGGYLNVSDLIETEAIVTNMLAAGSVTASKIQVSDFSDISGATLSGFTLTPSEIKATHGNRLISMFQDSTTSQFRIEPDTTQGAGFDFVGMFSKDNGAWGLRGRKNGNFMFQLGSTNQIAGWDFDADSLSKNNIELIPNHGGEGTIRINAGGENQVGMAGGSAGGDTVFWGGENFVDRGTAPFRVTLNGNLHAENADINGRIEATDGFLQNMNIDGTLTMSSLGQIVMEGSSVIKNDSFSMQAGHSSGENPYKIEFLYSGATGIGAAAIYGDEVELYIDAFTPNPQDYGRINIRGFISQPVHDGGTVSGSFGTVTLSKPVLAVIGDGSPRINRIEYDSGSPRDGDIVTFINYGNGSGVIFDSSAIAGSSNPNIKIPGPSGAEYTLPQDSAVKWIHYNTHWYRLR